MRYDGTDMKLPPSLDKPPLFQPWSRTGFESSRHVKYCSMISSQNLNLEPTFGINKTEPEQFFDEPTRFKRPRLVDSIQHLQVPSHDVALVSAEHLVGILEHSNHEDGFSSTSLQDATLASQFNPLSEPSPLGLMLRKSPSLLDLIQRRLTQNEGSEVKPQHEENQGTKEDSALLGSEKDKLKAANFPASFLRVGSWECKSRYDGDLVAKCYYAKRKLVWEILDRGLKSKMEVQWSDISALKAEFPEDQPSVLDIELSRPPQFFREINPQPRKHTLWQSSSDFTDGQATICRHHSVQFPSGVLNRHFEKLLQCDARLFVLNTHTHVIKDSCFFPNHNLHIDPQQMMHYQSLFLDHVASVQPSAVDTCRNRSIQHYVEGIEKDLPIEGIQGCTTLLAMPAGHSDAPPVRGITQLPQNLGMQNSLIVASPSSVIDTKSMDESSSSETEETSFREMPSCQALDARTHTSEQETLNELSLHLLGEPIALADHMLGKDVYQGLVRVDESQLFSKLRENYWNSMLENRSLEAGASKLSSHGSYVDLVYLPRIASWPQFYEPAR